MAQAQIRCHSCGTRAEVNLNEFELRTLGTQGHLIRFCRQCAGNTRWLGQASVPSGRLGAAAGLAPPGAGGGRILLIDDDENILKILGKVLSQEKFDLDIATSGREAILKLGREDYNLILSDIRMPELDGKELFAFLEANLPEYKKRVIFLTGDTGNADTMKFLEETGCPYLTKPIEIPTLVHMLYQYFGSA
jgi:CheY-like chemotaxis protein